MLQIFCENWDWPFLPSPGEKKIQYCFISASWEIISVIYVFHPLCHAKLQNDTPESWYLCTATLLKSMRRYHSERILIYDEIGDYKVTETLSKIG